MWSSTVVVHPWVGRNYNDSIFFKHKTLSLGESNFTNSQNFNSSLVIHCAEDDLESPRI